MLTLALLPDLEQYQIKRDLAVILPVATKLYTSEADTLQLAYDMTTPSSADDPNPAKLMQAHGITNLGVSYEDVRKQRGFYIRQVFIHLLGENNTGPHKVTYESYIKVLVDLPLEVWDEMMDKRSMKVFLSLGRSSI